MGLDLKALSLFLHVAREESFSKGAQAAGISQSRASDAVSGLEKVLEVRLFDRGGRRVALTGAGRVLVDYAEQLLALRDEATEAVRAVSGQIGGRVRLGASTIPGEYVLPRLIGSLTEANPGVKLEVSVAATGRIIDALEAGEVELAIVGTRDSRQGLRFEAVGADRLVLAMHPEHRWARRRKIKVAELLEEPLIMRGQRSGTRKSFEAAMRSATGRRRLDLNVVAELGSSAAVKSAILAGAGVSVISHFALRDEVAAGLLATAALAGLDPERPFYLATDGRRTLSGAAERTRAFICERWPND